MCINPLRALVREQGVLHGRRIAIAFRSPSGRILF